MILEIFAGLTLAIWVYILLFRRAEWQPAPPLVSKRCPVVVAIVPARNEESTIAAAIQSLDRQDYAGEWHIVLVDDDSEDETARRAIDAAPASRLTVVRADPLPQGWSGKLWAMAEGLRHAGRL